MRNVLYILLGWLLGLPTPWLAEIIQRPSKRSKVKQGIFVELKDLKLKLSTVALQVAMNRGDLDGELLCWFRKIVEADAPAFAKMTSDPRWELTANVTDEEIRTLWPPPV